MDELATRLAKAFVWLPGESESYADPEGWWRDADLLADTADALFDLHADERPTVVAGIESRGFILGAALAARHRLGFVEIQKDRVRALGRGDNVYRTRTPPDYNQRDLVLTLNRATLRPADRVLLVDEWIVTGAQATAARDLVEQAEAKWAGVSVIVDDLPSEARRRLGVRALLRKHQLF